MSATACPLGCASPLEGPLGIRVRWRDGCNIAKRLGAAKLAGGSRAADAVALLMPWEEIADEFHDAAHGNPKAREPVKQWFWSWKRRAEELFD
ncbi:MAG: hypothetical protein F4Z31_01640 [Gemmatimonadetes bacterium]|nr:hypothetical protein [Gemmatimonadota bacterium]